MKKHTRKLIVSFFLIFSMTIAGAFPEQDRSIAQVSQSVVSDDLMKSIVLKFMHDKPRCHASYCEQFAALYRACDGNVYLMGKFIMTYLRT